ncbi:MAG: laminin G domain-containing protein [Kiritimatiellae bacterium]|nr:laminin G domain-containing protein [Kiritimatiellia bacterium]
MSKTRIHLSLLAVAAVAAVALLPARALAADTIAYWPFGTNGFHDVSGNGHDLTSTTVTESDAGYVTLNGTSQFLTTASALDLSGETAVTFECWARSTGKNSSYGVLLSTPSPSGTSAGSLVMYYTGRLQAQYSMGSSGWQVDYTPDALPSAMEGGAWHHIAYVIDRSAEEPKNSAILYFDGVRMQDATSPNALAPALFNKVLYIGGGSGYVSGNEFFTGYIDDVRISRGVLTPDLFLKFPSVGKAMRSDDGKLPVVAYWPFGGKGGKDATGNGFDLTMNGVPMTSGTPSPSYGNYARTNCCARAFPLSAFSKTGLTIEMFAKTDSSGGGMVGTLIESSGGYYGTPGAFVLRYNDDNYNTVSASFLTSNSGGEKYVGSATETASFGDISDNKWRHFAVVYDPSKTGPGIVTLYIDGVAAPCTATDEAQKAFALADTGIYLTRRSYGTGRSNTFYGSIDDVRITGCALTPDQFLPARSAGSTVALYRFDKETIEDQTGNGNHLAIENGSATFGVGDDPASGTGIVLSGKNSKSEWLHTANPVDLTETTAMTVEVDYNCPNPKTADNSSIYALAASENATTSKGGFVIYRIQDGINAQFRKDSSNWSLLLNGSSLQPMDAVCPGGYRRIRYSVDAGTPGTVAGSLNVDGAVKSGTASDTLSSLGNLTLTFGHCPSYYGSTSSEPCYMKGKFLRVAVSDVVLAADDYVLDNLVLDTPKATLAYWNFSGSDDKSGSGHGLVESGTGRRNGALDLHGSASAATEDTLDLSGLTQATIECFVLFGETPSSGTIFGMGSGAGSFAVAADAAAGTLSGSFIPYDHLAASNGGSAALAPLAGKKDWHHVALVIDRTSPGADAVRFYVDYELATPAGRAWDAAARMLDGTLSVGSGFTGRIDDLRVSAGALAPEEFIQPAARTETADAFTLILN